MPVTTRLKARSVQSTDLVSSPGANTPRFIPGNFPGFSHDSRQANAEVTVSLYEGAPFEGVANGNHELQFDINGNKNNFNYKCGGRGCLTCDNLVLSDVYYSNVSHRKYNVINHTGDILSCKSGNIIYLLTCRGCNIQYVGETMQPVYMRMNGH